MNDPEFLNRALRRIVLRTARGAIRRDPEECSCGADATTIDLDGAPACALCAQVLAADPVAQADVADRRREEDEFRAERLAAAIASGEPPWWWDPYEGNACTDRPPLQREP